jgi:hypothetical protein
MFLCELLNVGYGDSQYIDELSEVLDDEGCIEEIREDLENASFKEIDGNLIIFSIFTIINERVFNKIKNRLEEETIEGVTAEEKDILTSVCEVRIDNFSPYINCRDSHFNNELENMCLSGRSLSQITDDVLALLISNCREGLYI